MATDRSRVLVIGATGQVGAAVLRHLSPDSPDSSVQATAAARSPEKVSYLEQRGHRAVLFDYDKPETIAPALEGIDSVFMATGYTVDMLRQSKTFLDRARKSGVEYVVHLGAAGEDDTEIIHCAWHQLVERYIEWSKFEYTHLRPEVFMQNLLGYGGISAVVGGVIRHFVGRTRLPWADCDDIAAVAAACLRSPKEHAGKTYRLGNDAKSFDEVAELFTRVIGQKFVYEPRPPSEFLEAMLANGADPAYMNGVYRRYMDFTAGKSAGADDVFANFQSITGREPQTLEDFARRHAEKFKY